MSPIIGDKMNNKYIQNSKVLNARKRFRQGRSSFKKLRSVIREEIRKFMENDSSNKVSDSLPSTENLDNDIHVHDESCHHFVKQGD